MKPILIFLGVGLLFVGLCCGAFAGFAKWTDDNAAKVQANMREITFEELKEKPPRAGVQFKLTEFNLINDAYLVIEEVDPQAPADEDPDSWGSAFIPVVGVDDPVDQSVDSFDYVLRSNMANTDEDAIALAQAPFLICEIGKEDLNRVLGQYDNNPQQMFKDMYPAVEVDQVVVLRHTATPAIPGGSGVGWFCFAISGAILFVAVVMLGLGVFLPSGSDKSGQYDKGMGVASSPTEAWPQPEPIRQAPAQPSSLPPPPIDRDDGGSDWSLSEPVGGDSPSTYSPSSYSPSTPEPSFYAPLRTSGFAIASLIAGILGIVTCCFFLPSILAIVGGHISLVHIKNSNGTVSGRNLGIAGLALGYCGFAMGVAYYVLIVVAP